jgi:hypothetical protein
MNDENTGVTPLEFLEAVYTNEGVPLLTRLKAAVEAAPYCHPKLAMQINASYANLGDRMEALMADRGVISSRAPAPVIDAKPIPQAEQPRPVRRF